MAELEIHHEGHEADPFGRTVGVIAAIIAVFLAAAASDFVTGAAITVDGGYSVQG